MIPPSNASNKPTIIIRGEIPMRVDVSTPIIALEGINIKAITATMHPRIPPMIACNIDSVSICETMLPSVQPMAFKMPISCLRSTTDDSCDFSDNAIVKMPIIRVIIHTELSFMPITFDAG